ncbi:MAG: glycine cleavage system protein GcvH [Candidatus Riflebacteria bacterium]|nr:glycine cleavage system protein GcvH [Candidatus Riflebacteria bacterium]
MVPTNYKYTKDHEWAKMDGKKVVMGVTDFAAKQLGDIVFVDMPQVGTKVEAGKTMGVIESVKTVSDLFSPVSGKIVARNDAIEGDPALVNQDPFGKGWLVEIELANPAEFDRLLSPKDYEDHVAHCGH